jgi:hypothetical protein
MIPDIIRGENVKIYPGEITGRGLPSVIYEKTLSDGHVLLVEEIQAGKMQLVFKNMWKKKPPEGGQGPRSLRPKRKRV